MIYVSNKIPNISRLHFSCLNKWLLWPVIIEGMQELLPFDFIYRYLFPFPFSSFNLFTAVYILQAQPLLLWVSYKLHSLIAFQILQLKKIFMNFFLVCALKKDLYKKGKKSSFKVVDHLKSISVENSPMFLILSLA